eukprot:COSAG05_NODE_2105_length_3552_cov_3.767738_2_plen_89_part_00
MCTLALLCQGWRRQRALSHEGNEHIEAEYVCEWGAYVNVKAYIYHHCLSWFLSHKLSFAKVSATTAFLYLDTSRSNELLVILSKQTII